MRLRRGGCKCTPTQLAQTAQILKPHDTNSFDTIVSPFAGASQRLHQQRDNALRMLDAGPNRC
jgi:hypothetical protein